MHDIAIVGLGANGISLLKQLDEENFDLKIAVINKSLYFSYGKAFGDVTDIHKVNTPPELMSLSYRNRNHYKTWLEQNGIYDKWPARKLYSKYLNETYNKIKAKNHLK